MSTPGTAAVTGTVTVTVTVNGRRHERQLEPRLLLSDFLRHDLGLTGTHVGCEHGVCGACTILLDGEPVRSCLLLAVQADERQIGTVEGLAGGRGGGPGSAGAEGEPGAAGGAGGHPGELHPLQEAFWETHGLQCGFCTPGFLMTLVPFLAEHPDPTEPEIRRAISGNLCRCTGYQHIVDAVLLAARKLAAAAKE
jgi:carbon-monoxide dehydrogenase small subunit